jgi:phosphoenolpyruvate carboxykinase (GTP)
VIKEGKKQYICMGTPTGSGKTTLATLIPTLPGWTLRCLGDDIAWLHMGEDGRLYAINPEAGFFDRVTGRK